MNITQRPSELLLAILEGFLDGILVVTQQQQVLYTNHTAHQLCQRLVSKDAESSVPAAIWHVCEALVESQELRPEKQFVMESELECEEKQIRVRVQWLSVEGCDRPCFLVRLQDNHQAAQSLATVEAHNWHLTERETQVWQLRRSGLSRKEIAAELYISQDTVKKHLGNVHAKRQSYLDEEAWQLEQPALNGARRSA